MKARIGQGIILGDSNFYHSITMLIITQNVYIIIHRDPCTAYLDELKDW